jgi:multidrug efflux system membrane fusion protein
MRVDRKEPLEYTPFKTMAMSVIPTSQRRVLIITAIVLAVLGFGFYQYKQFTAATTAKMLSRPRPPTPIEIAVAELQPIPQSISAIGTFQAMRQVVIAPEIGGRIVKIHFEPGAEVKAGDPLIQLYDAPQRADLANYQAQARLGALNLARSKELNARNFQSRQTLDQYQSTLDQAQANIAKVEAQLAQLLIRAPFSGQLGVRQVEVGSYVVPGAPIVSLTDLSRMWINFTLPEQAASQIHTGQTVRVQADAFPGRTFDAKVTAIEPQINAQTRMMLVQGTVSNDDHTLLPGMFGKVATILPDAAPTVVLPETAVDYNLYGESVYVVREDGKDDKGNPILKAARVTVKTGDRFDGKVAVISGLQGGERVAASGQIKLNDGAMVSILPGNTLVKPPETTRY